MNYLSICSGIEAATVAWHPLGWQPVAFAEIDKFPSAVLAHHYAEVPNVGDFTKISGDEFGAVDVLVGGTPCQDFSVAGLREGMGGARGQLTVEFAHLAGRLRPRWLVWENVPGVLSIDGGRAFGTFLGLVGQLGYGFAYRILDAQFFGVPQRRRRVFVVGYLGDWRRAAAVLFERKSLSGHPPPRREARKEVAPTISARTHGGGGLGTDFDCDGGLIAFGGNNTSGPIDVSTSVNACGTASGRMDFESETFVAAPLRAVNHHADQIRYESHLVTHSLRADGFDANEDGTGRGTPLVAQTITAEMYRSGGATAGNNPGVRNVFPCGMSVRRLTPRECERLQGFPDDYTKISPKAADGPRYKALGNSMAVPVMRWIGGRIAMVDQLEVAG